MGCDAAIEMVVLTLVMSNVTAPMHSWRATAAACAHGAPVDAAAAATHGTTSKRPARRLTSRAT
jgi:hypothetical protein